MVISSDTGSLKKDVTMQEAGAGSAWLEARKATPLDTGTPCLGCGQDPGMALGSILEKAPSKLLSPLQEGADRGEQ